MSETAVQESVGEAGPLLSQAPTAVPGLDEAVRPLAPQVFSHAALSAVMDKSEFRAELRTLRDSPLFWVGVALKFSFAFLFGSHFATRFFGPFLYEFVHHPLVNPWQTFFARGEPLAFPYGPGMLFLASLPWLPASLASFHPTSHLALLLLRIPCFAADLTICVLLMRWLRIHARFAIAAYWLSPIVIYATYVHGQLDLIPTALLCVALFLIFTRRTLAAGVVFGFALATKAHLFIAAGFAFIYLFRLRKGRLEWAKFGVLAAVTSLALYAIPLASPAFRQMVLGSAESRKVWSLAIPYGASGLVLYAAPAGLIIAFLRFASYRKLNRELTMMFLGVVYVGLVALVPPQPGWFIWSIPFVAYLGARFSRTGRFALALLSSAYLAYFFIGDPGTFLEAADPLLGQGFGQCAAASLLAGAPAIFGPHGASVAWTVLSAVTALTAYEMYRRGVRSNSIYSFRDETFMVGIGGDSGAGKHTIGRDLASLLGPQISLIDGDDDHRWERGHAMWHRYTHLDPRGNRLTAQLDALAALRRGGNVRRRHYDHDKGKFTAPLLVKPNDFIAIIGLHPFYLSSQRELFHLKIFVDPPEELRRAWKVTRDVAKRGYTPERVIAQIEQRMPDSLKYVRPQQKYADVVIRQLAEKARSPSAVDFEIELSSQLEPLTLLEVLDNVPTLTVAWEPDEALTRDRFVLSGEIEAEHVRIIAQVAIPNVEELIAQDAWMGGGRGLTQLVILHALSARLRRAQGKGEGG